MSMILADTSVWVDHLRSGNDRLSDYLNEGRVVCHQFIIGELACENLKNRIEILGMLGSLPSIQIAAHEEVLYFISKHRLHGRRIGWIDAHLLASTMLARCSLWTMDKPLQKVAKALKLSI